MNNKRENNKKENILKQFYLDVNRLTLFLEGSICTEDPDYVKKYLYENLENDEAIIAIYTLTQTFLADYYIDEFKKVVNIDGQQLLDNLNYVVRIDTQKKLVHISKEFKIVYFFEDKCYVIDYCTLSIHVYLDILSVLYSWSYEFEIDKPLIIETKKLQI
jgi:hypothetical protein